MAKFVDKGKGPKTTSKPSDTKFPGSDVKMLGEQSGPVGSSKFKTVDPGARGALNKAFMGKMGDGVPTGKAATPPDVEPGNTD